MILLISATYDHSVVEQMQGLDLGPSHPTPGSNYGSIDRRQHPTGSLDRRQRPATGSLDRRQPHHPAEIPYDSQPPPQPPRDNNQMAAWYDTDL